MNIEQTVSAAVADLQLGHTFTLDDLIHAIQARRQRTLRVHELQDLDCETEITAEALADRLAAGIRGHAFAESRYLEVFG